MKSFDSPSFPGRQLFHFLILASLFHFPDPAAAQNTPNNPDPNRPPRIEIVRPAHEQIFNSPDAIEVEVATVDPDGWVSQVDFFANGDLIGSENIVFIQPPPPGQ